MEAIGLEPAGVPGAVVDPVEDLHACRVALAGVADHRGVVGLPAARLAGRHEAELALRTEDLLRLLDLLGGHGRVRPQSEHHQMRESMPAAGIAENPKALGELAAAAGVRLVADPRERR